MIVNPTIRPRRDEAGIEVPIGPWPVPAAHSTQDRRRLIRISSALHNGPDDVDRLVAALGRIATTEEPGR